MKHKKLLLTLCTVLIVCGMLFAMSLSVSAAEVPELSFATATLSLRDAVCIKYAVPIPEGIPSSDIKVLVWTSPQTDYSVNQTPDRVLSAVGTATVNGAVCYVFDYTGVSARQMTDVVYARVYARVNGTDVYSDVKSFSVLHYAYRQFGRIPGETPSSDTALLQLLNDMLTYGASAQTYMNYKTDRLPTADFQYIGVRGGVLQTGAVDGLFLPGEALTLTAPSTNAAGEAFVCWKNLSGTTVSESTSCSLTVSHSADIYTAYYAVSHCLHENTTITSPRLASATQTALTEGVICDDCGETLVKALHPDAYQSTNGYDFLGTQENGASLQALYLKIDEIAQNYHLNSYYNQGTTQYTEYYDVSNLNVPVSQLQCVMNTYFAEHQLYYWYHGASYYYNPDSNTIAEVALVISEDYIDPTVRTQLNVEIYQAIQEMAIDDPSAYNKALYYHDTILENMYYAYKSDGVTPEDAAWAHNVVGYVQYGAGVCETYAEIFHLMMNYSGVDCIRVQGDAGGGHAWNLVKMDDGEWYWFDLTWDDYTNGFGHTYFCVNDTDSVNSRGDTFMTSHTPDTPASGSRYLFTLPARSPHSFNNGSIQSNPSNSDYLHSGTATGRNVNGLSEFVWEAMPK